ncbi:MAG TPA: MarR family transcriptional regulator [Treponemataceae bacterium]|jgi:DNA-binding MarR family transcriptional regulator|nr:MarR family transcriptional regulator [Treponemataceae bacterium]
MILKSRAPKMMGMMLRQVHLGLQRRSENEFSKYGINWTDFQVVRFLSERSADCDYESTQKEIAEFMQLTVHAVSKSLKNLEEKEYVTLGNKDTGASSKGIKVTDNGKYFCSQMFKVLCKMEMDLLSGISSRDQGIIRNGLMKMFENLQEN